jgi:hypothetical protein
MFPSSAAAAANPGAVARLPKFFMWAAALIMAGCISPTGRIDEYARRHGLERAIVVGESFRHVVFRNRGAILNASLHVYIEGDGSPFLNSTTVAADPTPRQPIMLHLMALDMHRAVYIGRPCYLEANKDAACGSVYWTHRRFSPEVVDSLARVVRSEMAVAGASFVQIYGHSGGGALAVLLARANPQVSDIVTIAGNLDTDAWSRLHGYTALTGSLNPVDVVLSPLLAAHTDHLVGSADQMMPAAMVRTAAARIGGQVVEYDRYSHQCCWERQWLAVLQAHSR